MGVELEWKYAADPAALEAVLRAYPGPWRTVEMETRYYDTAGGALAARRWTLRLRRENGAAVACLKTPADGRARNEWEAPCAGPEALADALTAAGAPAELAALTAPGLTEVCGARFTRRALLVDGAELALDRGVLTGGGREAPLCEAELEHKSGDPAATAALAARLAARFGLREEPRSKFARALALRNGAACAE